MNNKGFGIPHVMAFAIFVFIVIYAFYSFCTSAGKLFSKGSNNKNYKNVYRQYITTSAVFVPNNNSNSNDIDLYSNLELELANSAKQYINKKDLKISTDQSFYISYNTLKNLKLITELKDPVDNTSCSGYSKAININDSIIYKGYIMCGSNYKTVGYNTKYE